MSQPIARGRPNLRGAGEFRAREEGWCGRCGELYGIGTVVCRDIRGVSHVVCPLELGEQRERSSPLSGSVRSRHPERDADAASG